MAHTMIIVDMNFPLCVLSINVSRFNEFKKNISSFYTIINAYFFALTVDRNNLCSHKSLLVGKD